MRNYGLTKLWGMVLIGLCLTGNILTSCTDDEPVSVVLTDPTEMTLRSFYAYDGDLDILLNGEELPDGRVTFEPVENDSTQLLMTIGNVMPACEAQALVDIVPGEGVVTFEGTNERLLKTGYRIQVSGTFYEDGRVEVVCELLVGDSIVEVPYEYHFSKGVLHAAVCQSGTVEWQGQVLEKGDFVQSVLDKIVERIAQEVTDLKLVFHGDWTFDTWLKRAGQTDYELWMTAGYWIEGQTMYWFLTPEQHTMFCEQWFGLPQPDYTPFRSVLVSEWRYVLPVLFWGSADQFDWTIWNPNRYDALDSYLQGKGMEGLTEEERQEMELFRKVLYDVEDLHDWMSWNIKLYSEPISPSDPDWNR